MRKPNVKKVKFSPEEMAYDLPDELDFSKLEYGGRGLEAIERHAAGRIVNLAPDVAAAFRSSAEVNKALRERMASKQSGSARQRKSA